MNKQNINFLILEFKCFQISEIIIPNIGINVEFLLIIKHSDEKLCFTLLFIYNWIPIPDVGNSNFQYQSTNPMRDISKNQCGPFLGVLRIQERRHVLFFMFHI